MYLRLKKNVKPRSHRAKPSLKEVEDQKIKQQKEVIDEMLDVDYVPPSIPADS